MYTQRLISAVVWQKPTQNCKASILQINQQQQQKPRNNIVTNSIKKLKKKSSVFPW